MKTRGANALLGFTVAILLTAGGFFVGLNQRPLANPCLWPTTAPGQILEVPGGILRCDDAPLVERVR